MPTGREYFNHVYDSVERTNPVPEWLKKHIKPGREERAVLHEILTITDHDAPGIYEPEMIERVNTLARKILDMPVVSDFAWPHNTPEHEDMGVAKNISLVNQALEKLSGDLSYDNVSAAKQILKEIL